MNPTPNKCGSCNQPQAKVDQGPKFERKPLFHPRLKAGRPPKSQPKQHWVKK